MRQVRAGEADLVVVGGVESMSRAPFVMAKAETAFDALRRGATTPRIGWRFVNERLAEQHGTDAMGETAENVAEDHGSRARTRTPSRCAVQQRTAAAQAEGWFAGRDRAGPGAPSDEASPAVVDTDEHPRADTTARDPCAAAAGVPRRAGA